MTEKRPAILMLEDGRCFEGAAFGAFEETFGEVVFNTSMTGYQEILTDPSYSGQIVCLTYPLIGNYGIVGLDDESEHIQVAGLLIKELSGIASSHRCEERLEDYLARHNVMAMEGFDTRALVLHIRTKGAMRAAISTDVDDREGLLRRVLASPTMVGRELATKVSSDKPYEYQSRRHYPSVVEGPNYRVVVFDLGVKRNILELMCSHGITPIVVPATTSASEVNALRPDGLFLSNGPGDPVPLVTLREEVAKLLPKYPTFGICLGHQVVGLALGGKSYKLKFGHRGANHPVKDMRTGQVAITSQNHGFCIDPDSLPSEMELTHWNLNDKTLEGMRHRELPIFCVQYHPEAAPGPHDSSALFMEFRRDIAAGASA